MVLEEDDSFSYQILLGKLNEIGGEKSKKNDSTAPYILKFEIYVEIYICILALKTDKSFKRVSGDVLSKQHKQQQYLF